MMTDNEFWVLLKKHTPYLKNFALKLTTDRNDAEDLYQETVFRLLKNKNKFSSGTNFKAWSSFILKNLYINDWRRRKICPFHYAEPEVLPNISQQNYFNHGESSLGVADLEKEINQLPEKNKTSFLLFCKGHPYKEIAVSLGIPLGSVKSRIFQARKILKRRLAHSGYLVAA